ncbi:hypothetical protein HY620_00015 [Candidatus Uhrbacteria bacterium]|nr:hypothetical protein [Candidatus Uhrbacteria bacterium]
MASHSRCICADQRGIILIELILAIGILSLIAIGGASLSFHALRHQAASQQLLLLTSLLQEARHYSLARADGLPHGVRLEQERFVFFVGHTYSSRIVSKERSFPVESSVSKNGAQEIVFALGSADATVHGDITLLTTNYERTITVTRAGGIILQ